MYQLKLHRLLQDKDGRVKGPCAHILWAHQNHSKQLSKKWPESTQKRYSISKHIKKKPRDGRRGALIIQSNLIPPRWATHRLDNNYITKVLPQEWQLWALHQGPQPKGPALGGGGPQSILLWKPGGLDCRLRETKGTMGKRLNSWRAKIRSYTHWNPGQKHWFHRSLGQTYLLVFESLLGRWQVGGSYISHWVLKLVVDIVAIYVNSSWRPTSWVLDTKTWPHTTACRLQCWDASGQPTHKPEIQPQLSADRLTEPTETSRHAPGHALAHQRAKTQLQRQVGRHEPLLPRKTAQASNQPHTPGGRHLKQEN